MSNGIGSLQTNVSALNGLAQIKKTSSKLSVNLEQLSSGKHLVNASVSPADLAIATAFESQVRGYDVAVQNAQDAVNLAQTADASLNSTTDVLLRQRDIAVRAANDATLTASDRQNLNNEFQALTQEVDRQAQTADFNNKQLRDGSYGTQAAQVGPGAGVENQVNVTLNDTTAGAGGLNTTGSSVDTVANAQNAIGEIDQALSQVATERSNVGVTQRRLESSANDAVNQRINLDEARSRVADTDFIRRSAENAQLRIQLNLQVALQSHAQVGNKALASLLK